MIGIYLIENLITNEIYIGQSINIERRWKDHKKSKNDYYLYRAFRKYKIQNFSFTVLEQVQDPSQLTEREQYWYEIMKPEYNNIEPKKPLATSREVNVIQIDKKMNIIKEYQSITQASKETNISIGDITTVCRRKNTSSGGYYWVYKDEYNVNWKPRSNKYPLKKVLQIDAKTLEPLLWYDSINEASWANNLHQTSISHAISGKSKTSGGYIWQYLDKE